MKITDCHYCEYAFCDSPNSEVCCYMEDGYYFDHVVINSKKEAKECSFFKYCDSFPKY